MGLSWGYHFTIEAPPVRKLLPLVTTSSTLDGKGKPEKGPSVQTGVNENRNIFRYLNQTYGRLQKSKLLNLEMNLGPVLLMRHH